jgi:hypothetical protein
MQHVQYMLDGHAAWKYSMCMQHVHVAQTFSMKKQQDAACTCSIDINLDMRHEHAGRTCSMDMQHWHAALACSVDMQQGPCSKDKQYALNIYTYIKSGRGMQTVKMTDSVVPARFHTSQLNLNAVCMVSDKNVFFFTIIL